MSSAERPVRRANVDFSLLEKRQEPTCDTEPLFSSLQIVENAEKVIFLLAQLPLNYPFVLPPC